MNLEELQILCDQHNELEQLAIENEKRMDAILIEMDDWYADNDSQTHIVEFKREPHGGLIAFIKLASEDTN